MSYVGFELIKLTKCLSGDNGNDYGNSRATSDNPFFYYEWTHWTRGGSVTKQEAKVDDFFSIVKGKSITRGRVGYYKAAYDTKWTPITEEMFESILADWLDYSTREIMREEDVI